MKIIDIKTSMNPVGSSVSNIIVRLLEDLLLFCKENGSPSIMRLEVSDRERYWLIREIKYMDYYYIIKNPKNFLLPEPYCVKTEYERIDEIGDQYIFSIIMYEDYNGEKKNNYLKAKEKRKKK